MKNAPALAFMTLGLLLAGCESVLPDPDNGFHGREQIVTEGKAFGVSIGMDRNAVAKILKDRGEFDYKLRTCVKKGGDFKDPDYSIPNSKTVDCPRGDYIEIWRADWLGGVYYEVLDLLYRSDRLYKIKWWRVRTIN